MKNSIPSPCTNDCVFDGETSLCLGCHRTLDEVIDWARYDLETKQAVLRRIEARRAESDE
jgi:hypothetical protein